VRTLAAANTRALQRCEHKLATPARGLQVLKNHLALALAPADAELLVEKFVSPDYGDLVNYVAFAAAVDPPAPAYDPYTLGL
jgi:hypothetical protein